MDRAKEAAEEIAEIVVFWALKYNQNLKVKTLADAYELIIRKHFPSDDGELAKAAQGYPRPLSFASFLEGFAELCNELRAMGINNSQELAERLEQIRAHLREGR